MTSRLARGRALVRRQERLVLGVAVTAGLGVAVGGLEAALEPLPRWMTGCWAGTVGTSRVHERWMAADAATMIGVSHTVKDGRLAAFEFLRIVARPDAVVYLAQPGGRPPTEFRVTSQADGAIVFENPAHDFPKRIGYDRTGLTGLTAWIDGGPAAPGGRTAYPLTRVACEP